MASDIIQNWASAEQKTVAATISIHTHTHTPPTLLKTPRISATIKSKFNFQKYFFRHCIQCKKIKLTLPKIGEGAGPPWIRPDHRRSVIVTPWCKHIHCVRNNKSVTGSHTCAICRCVLSFLSYNMSAESFHCICTYTI